MYSKEINKQMGDISVGHGLPDLIPPGTYIWQIDKVEVNEKFMKARKAYFRGTIIPPSQYAGVNLFMVCSMPKSGQCAGIRSKYLASWIVANNGQRPKRKDRLSTSIFKNAIFEVEVRTAAKDEKGIGRCEALHYSIVDRLIKRHA